MHEQLLSKLSALPPLAPAAKSARLCKVCGFRSELFDVVDFNKHCSEDDPYKFEPADIPVQYYRCPCCELIFTDLLDRWTDAEIARFIYNEDYLKVDSEYIAVRPARMATTLAAELRGCENMRILDYGAGSGEFEKEMRARGYSDVISFDPYSSSSSRRAPEGLFDIVVLSEVVEHAPNPLRLLRQVCQSLSPSGTVIVGQSLQPEDIDRIRGRWWYIGPRNGHVCFFSEKTFMLMAAKVGLTYYRGRQLYGFARPRVAPAIARALKRIGHSMHLLELVAAERDESSWHSLERSDGQDFRWSRVPAISWPDVSFSGGPTTLLVPFLMEIREGFADECVIAINHRRLNTTVEKRAIIAQADVKTGIHSVQLLTPAPLIPRAVSGANDDRPLGIAIVANS